jgi:nitroreductase
MNLSEALDKRRSIRVFDKTATIGEEEIRRLITSAMKAPSSSNVQHWRFVLIKDPALRNNVRAAAFNREYITDASLLVAICADVKAWQKSPERYWANAPAEFGARVVSNMERFYGKNAETERDAALYSIGLSTMALLLAATEMGYGSLPIAGFEQEKVARLINLPKDHIVGLLVAIGKPAADPIPKPGQLPHEELVFTDTF